MDLPRTPGAAILDRADVRELHVAERVEEQQPLIVSLESLKNFERHGGSESAQTSAMPLIGRGPRARPPAQAGSAPCQQAPWECGPPCGGRRQRARSDGLVATIGAAFNALVSTRSMAAGGSPALVRFPAPPALRVHQRRWVASLLCAELEYEPVLVLARFC